MFGLTDMSAVLTAGPPTRPVTITRRAWITAFMNARNEADTPASAPTSKSSPSMLLTIITTLTLAQDLPSFEKRLNERDARELHRREISKREISQLDTAEAKERAQKEEYARIEEYERNRKLVVRAREQATAGDPMAGSYRQGVVDNGIREPQARLEFIIPDSTISPPQHVPIVPGPEGILPPLPKQRFLERIILKWVL